MDEETIKEIVKEALEEILFSSDEYSPFNRLQDSVQDLLEVNKAEERMRLAVATADKFEDYMKNVDKLNLLINEFKGLVAIIRGEGKVHEKESKKLRHKLKKMLEVIAE